MVAYGSGSGNMAITLKQFKRLGVKSWEELASAKEKLSVDIIHFIAVCLGFYIQGPHGHEMPHSQIDNIIIKH